MKLRESNIDIPVILTSGFFNKDIENAALAVGISDLIIKPVDTYHLTDAIRKAFQS